MKNCDLPVCRTCKYFQKEKKESYITNGFCTRNGEKVPIANVHNYPLGDEICHIIGGPDGIDGKREYIELRPCARCYLESGIAHPVGVWVNRNNNITVGCTCNNGNWRQHITVRSYPTIQLAAARWNREQEGWFYTFRNRFRKLKKKLARKCTKVIDCFVISHMITRSI